MQFKVYIFSVFVLFLACFVLQLKAYRVHMAQTLSEKESENIHLEKQRLAIINSEKQKNRTSKIEFYEKKQAGNSKEDKNKKNSELSRILQEFGVPIAVDPVNTNVPSASDVAQAPVILHNPQLDSVIFPEWLNNQMSELDTFMTDSYNYFVTPKGNRVWVGGMNLMWDQLKRGILGGQNAVFRNINSVVQGKLVENLNQGKFTKDDISENSYYTASGFGQETINRINRELRVKFPNRTFNDLNIELKEEDFIAMAYIYKRLEFAVPFTEDKYFYFKDQNVPAFQMKSSKQRKQLYCKYWNSESDFMMGIQTTNPNEEILLIKNPYTPVNNYRFQKIIKMVEMYENLPNQELSSLDYFRMPVLDFDYARIFQEMKGLVFNNTELQGRSIDSVFQKIKFKVTKEGVVLENQAQMLVGLGQWGNPRFFSLDKDFWIILKEKNRAPYLIMLVRSVKETWAN